MRKNILFLLFAIHTVVAISQRYPITVHRRVPSVLDPPGSGNTPPNTSNTPDTGNTSGNTGNTLGNTGNTPGSTGDGGNGGNDGGSGGDTGAPGDSSNSGNSPQSSNSPSASSNTSTNSPTNTASGAISSTSSDSTSKTTSAANTLSTSPTSVITNQPTPTDQQNSPSASSPSPTNTGSPASPTSTNGQTPSSSPATSSTSKQGSPSSGAASNNNNDSSLPTGTIIGLSVAGGVAVFAFVAFLIWKLTRKRFHGLDDIDEAIKWPEVGRDTSNNAGYATGPSTDNLPRETSPSYSAPSRDFLPEMNDPYAVPPLPHFNPSLPYRDDPNNSGYYDPYRGPAPTALYEGNAGGHENIPLDTLPTNTRTRSPAPGVALDLTGRGSPALGALSYQPQTGQSAYGQSGTAPYRSY